MRRTRSQVKQTLGGFHPAYRIWPKRENLLGQQANSRTENQQNPEFKLGIGRLLVLLVIYFIISGVSSVIIALLPVTSNFSQALLVGQVIAWPVTILIALQWGGGTFREICPLGPFPVRIVPALILVGFGMELLLVKVAGWIPVPESLQAWLTSELSTGKLTLFFSAVIIAPVTEELFFRGPALQGFLGRYTQKRAIWVTAIFFALFHGLPWQMVVSLPVGLVSAWLVIRTRTLWPSILFHATVNLTGLVFVPLLIQLFAPNSDQLKVAKHYPLPLLFIGLGAFAIGGYFLGRELEGVEDQQAFCVSDPNPKNCK